MQVKRRWIVIGLLFLLFGAGAAGGAWLWRSRSSAPAPIAGYLQVRASTLQGGALPLGEAVQLKLSSDSPTDALRRATLYLSNGLQARSLALTLDAEASATLTLEAVWLAEVGTVELHQVGGACTSCLVLRFTVQPAPDATPMLELLTSANLVSAYGEGQAQLIALRYDAAGNLPASDIAPPVLRFQTSRAQSAPLAAQRVAGFGLWWWNFRSVGVPGRVRLEARNGVASAALELRQAPAPPAQIRLWADASCLRPDGRDLLMLRADVVDAFGQAVADGTRVLFRAQTGGVLAGGSTDAGRASARLPAPARVGEVAFFAQAGRAHSAPYIITSQEACP